MQIKFELTKASIQNAINEIKKYQEKIPSKMETFVDRLLEVGIKMAESRMPSDAAYKGSVSFEKDGVGFYLSSEEDATAIQKLLVAKDTRALHVTKDGRAASPSYMAEFGSGWLAEVLDDIGGVGQGTFPEQTHAFSESGWFYTDENGQRAHSFGETPTHPMHYAMIEMIQQVDSIAREVFS